jgi:hypothetical protein
MKKILLALSLAAAFGGSPSYALAAPGDDPQTVAAVKDMLDAMDIHKTMAATYAQMEQAMPAMIKSQMAAMVDADSSLNAQQKTEAKAKLDRTMSTMLKSMGGMFRDPVLIDEMVNEMVPLYARHFTTAEIKDLAAFYRTSTGRKMLANLPRISAESAAISQKVIMPRMGKIMQDVMQELQKQ